MFKQTLSVWIIVLLIATASADTLELTDGTVLKNCFVRDEGIHLLVWTQMADVGTPRYQTIPRSQLKTYKIERDDSWGAHPQLPDLSVTFIEMSPTLAGLHGRVEYDQYGRPSIGGGNLPDLGERAFAQPEEVVKGVKLKYNPSEAITLTAHVKNLGFATAKPFDYA